ncbi:acyl-coenzyme A thioesterase 13-like [Senna tora]|uniref:Acyl-coenzyme A thioesterase 13-like n=1 Tax=Senna tora TaxID=362788 RepID=A0A834WF00_9FABA|nr:acyl-coenzyme A thioesterase 13-like [Senna tora]
MATKPSSSPSSPSPSPSPQILSSISTPESSKEIDPRHAYLTLSFLETMGIKSPIPHNCNAHDFYSDILRSCLKVDRIQRGRITCTFLVKPSISNFFKSLHGGAFAAAVELVSIACARSVVAEDKQLFLGEISLAYLSGAPQNAELQADGSVVKSGRNVTVVALEFKHKKTGKLIYTARVTFYNMPVANL